MVTPLRVGGGTRFKPEVLEVRVRGASIKDALDMTVDKAFDHFAKEPLPRPPSFNEADVSDKPAAVRNRALIAPARINAIQENYQQRLESLLAVDDAVAKVVNELSRIGKLDDTYIIFTSDNGFMHGEHRIQQGKVVLYEPSIRVPLLMRGPGIPRGQHRSQFVANIDLAPTIVQATGAKPGRVMDGRSLIPFAKDKLLQSGRADFALLEFAGTPDMRIEHGGVKLIPVPDRKVSLPGGRSWIVSRHSPHAAAIVPALNAGLAVLREQGRIENAFRGCGFFQSKVARWKRITDRLEVAA